MSDLCLNFLVKTRTKTKLFKTFIITNNFQLNLSMIKINTVNIKLFKCLHNYREQN